MILLLSFALAFVPSAKCAPVNGSSPLIVEITLNREYYLRGESAQITIHADTNITMTLKIFDPVDTIVFWKDITTDENGTHIETFPISDSALYGRYTLKALLNSSTITTWFWVQKVDGLVPVNTPYLWTWKGVDYTLDNDYILHAEGFDGKLSLDWLSEIFVKLKPTVTVYRNEYLVLIRTVGKDISADHWLMNQYKGLKIRINGTLAKDTTLKWDFKNLADTEVVWRVNRFSVGHLTYDWSDYDKTGVTYSMDKTNLKMDVFLSTSFDIDPYVFEDGFESGDFSAWDSTRSDNGGSISVSSDYAHHGTYSEKVVLANQASSYAWASYSIYPEPLMFARFQVKFSALPPNSGDWEKLSPFVRYPGPTFLLFPIVKNDTGTIKWGLYYVPTSTEYLGTNTPSVDTEYCVEIYYKKNTGGDNGEIKLYIDDVEEVAQTGLSETYVLNSFDNGAEHGSGSWSNTIYIDCVAVDTSYIGPESEANTAPTIGSFTASKDTVQQNEIFTVSAKIDDYDGVADFKNTTIEFTGSVVLKWDNATDTFTEYSDPNGYCLLRSGSQRTTLNGTAYQLTWALSFYENYTEGSIDVVATNTKVYDNAGDSASGSQAGLFTFQTEEYSPPGGGGGGGAPSWEEEEGLVPWGETPLITPPPAPSVPMPFELGVAIIIVAVLGVALYSQVREPSNPLKNRFKRKHKRRRKKRG